MIKFKLEKASVPKILINVGALFDIPTGKVVTGSRGEAIINGGLQRLTGLVGPGNSFKSTIIHYLAASAYDKIAYSTDKQFLHTYDTEGNIDIDRIINVTKRFSNIDPDMFYDEEPVWSTTDESSYSGDVWIQEVLRPTIKEKLKAKDYIIEYTAFVNPNNRKERLKTFIPSFVEVDSLSRFEGAKSVEMLEKAKKAGDTNMIYMDQGKLKDVFISELPRLMNSSNTYFLTTAHITEEKDMAGPMQAWKKPTKKLQHGKAGDKIKGVPPNFYYLMSIVFSASSGKLLLNDNTKLPEYPKTDSRLYREELNLVNLTILRNKAGASGAQIPILLSQDEGVLPSLSEFHYIKSNNRYGLDGSNLSYNLFIYPDVKLSRTTVRDKIDSDKKLRRALNITAELLQISIFMPRYKDYICTPEELYNDIKKLGYDWDKLLETRGWWTIDQYSKELDPFLSTVDLLRMRKGEYIPYWLDTDTKNKIKENIKKDLKNG